MSIRTMRTPAFGSVKAEFLRAGECYAGEETMLIGFDRDPDRDRFAASEVARCD